MHEASSRQTGAAGELAAKIWSDRMLADRFKADPDAVLKQFGIAGVNADELGIADSPVGDLPFEGPSYLMATTVSHCATSSCGTWYSVTTECGCSNTTTGGCSCGSVYGTLCYTCS